MKRTFRIIQISILAVFLIRNGIYAQEKKFEAAVHLGPAATRICCATMDINSDYYFQLAPAAGIGLTYNVNEYLGFSSEMNYARIISEKEGLMRIPRGSVLGVSPAEELYAKYRNRIALDYLEIPLLLRRSIGRRFKVFTVAGPYFGFLIGAHSKSRGRGIMYEDQAGSVPAMIDSNHAYPEESFNSDSNMKDALNTISIGGCGGLGVSYLQGTGRISLELRYSLGLTNIWRDRSVNGSNKTDNLILFIGYAAPLGR